MTHLVLLVLIVCTRGFNVGMVAISQTLFDGNFQQSGYIGLTKAVRDFPGVNMSYLLTNVQAAYFSGNETFYKEEVDKIEQYIVASQSKLIVTFSFTSLTLVQQLAPKYKSVNWLAIDTALDNYTGYDNVQCAVFANDEAGYMAGIVAATVSKTKKIGMVSGVRVVMVLSHINGGAKNGIYSVCPTCRVFVNYTESFTDPNLGIEAAKKMISQGCDVIMGAGGLTGSSGVLYAAENQIWGTGVDTDEYNTTFAQKPKNVTQYLLTSWIKRVDTAVYTAVQDIYNNRWVSGSRLFSLSNDGVSLAPCHDSCGFWPDGLSTLQDNVQLELSSGALPTGMGSDYGFTGHFQPNNTWYLVHGFNDVPPPLTGHTLVLRDENSMYVFGGVKSKNQPYDILYKYNHFYEEWTIIDEPTNATVPALESHVAVVYMDNMYVHGGKGVGGDNSPNMWKYSFANNTWNLLNSDSPSLSGHGAHVYMDSMYIFGGNKGQLSLADLWTYSFVENTWTKLTTSGSGPPELLEFCMGGVNDTIFVFGGSTIVQAVSTLSDVLYVYNIPSNTWNSYNSQKDNSWPTASRGCSIIGVDQRAILYAGFSTKFESSVWIFDLRFKEFTQMPNDKTQPPGRVGHTSVFLNDTTLHILTFGGATFGTLSDELYLYSIRLYFVIGCMVSCMVGVTCFFFFPLSNQDLVLLRSNSSFGHHSTYRVG
eukprot:TRINITY_DN15147_c0_g1_i1.p1 TRINITY_DN15147_c0_g1~~TRINITY_DN15147_c0_g1_i1.p1  ORF type:complete len:704 (-),score=100.09 TRINITY_DN15147_c0_g1_i1:1241-3352(-)